MRVGPHRDRIYKRIVLESESRGAVIAGVGDTILSESIYCMMRGGFASSFWYVLLESRSQCKSINIFCLNYTVGCCAMPRKRNSYPYSDST